MIGGDVDNVMGWGFAAADADVHVLLQEGGGGATLGMAMSLHRASVLPTHSAHLICLDDQLCHALPAAAAAAAPQRLEESICACGARGRTS